jgi:drug/metabolite transporter (DMT)-like permease
MTTLALVLVLCSAVIHASWNYLAKRVGGGVTFVWLFAALSGLIYAPLGIGIIILQKPVLGLPQIGFVAVSALIHLTYFTLLSRGYRVGDLSLVYPLARGTGPLLSTFAAILFLGERPTVIAVCGAALIGVGVFVLTGNPRKFREAGNGSAVVYALLTGLTIAMYTLWDKQGVTLMLIPPLLYDWLSNTIRVAALAPYALSKRHEVIQYWREHKREALGVALLSPLSYILMLTALTISPISYVAPGKSAFSSARCWARGCWRRATRHGDLPLPAR